MDNVATEASYKQSKPCSVENSHRSGKIVMNGNIWMRKHQKDKKAEESFTNGT